jgi:hypothetical protein
LLTDEPAMLRRVVHLQGDGPGRPEIDRDLDDGGIPAVPLSGTTPPSKTAAPRQPSFGTPTDKRRDTTRNATRAGGGADPFLLDAAKRPEGGFLRPRQIPTSASIQTRKESRSHRSQSRSGGVYVQAILPECFQKPGRNRVKTQREQDAFRFALTDY